MSENPFASPEHTDAAKVNQKQAVSEAQAAYNVVTDTVTGVNIRWSDNKFQAICVLVSTLLAAITGAILAAVNTSWRMPWYAGALVGAFPGLVLGILGSGIFLMVYRVARHLKGKHD
ncbi:MAG: hypothetical protein R3C53_19685 [Pirellulaceae bacterium]